MTMEARTDRRRQVREMVGWGILTTVVRLSRFVVWMDRALDRDAQDDAS